MRSMVEEQVRVIGTSNFRFVAVELTRTSGSPAGVLQSAWGWSG